MNYVKPSPFSYEFLHRSRPHLLDVAGAAGLRVRDVVSDLSAGTRRTHAALAPLAAVSVDAQHGVVVVVQNGELVSAALEGAQDGADLVVVGIHDRHARTVETPNYMKRTHNANWCT